MRMRGSRDHEAEWERRGDCLVKRAICWLDPIASPVGRENAAAVVGEERRDRIRSAERCMARLDGDPAISSDSAAVKGTPAYAVSLPLE